MRNISHLIWSKWWSATITLHWNLSTTSSFQTKHTSPQSLCSSKVKPRPHLLCCLSEVGQRVALAVGHGHGRAAGSRVGSWFSPRDRSHAPAGGSGGGGWFTSMITSLVSFHGKKNHWKTETKWKHTLLQPHSPSAYSSPSKRTLQMASYLLATIASTKKQRWSYTLYH